MSQSSADQPQFCGQCGHRLHSTGVCVNPQCSLYNQRMADILATGATSNAPTVVKRDEAETPALPMQGQENQFTVPPPPPPNTVWQPGASSSTQLAGASQPTPLPTSPAPPPPTPTPIRQRRPGGLYIGTIVLLSILLLISLSFNFLKMSNSSQPGASTTSGARTSQSQGEGSQQGSLTTATATSQSETPLTPTPTPSPSAQVAPGTVLCQADATHGWNGWSGSSDWKLLKGQLLNDGTNDDQSLAPTISAPCSLNGITNYAVEVTIQIISSNDSFGDGFGIAVRGDPTQSPWQGYIAAITYTEFAASPYKAVLAANQANSSGQLLASVPFDPGSRSHTYRVEAKDNSLKFFIDGGQVLAVTDNRYLTTTQVGLASQGFQLVISSFKVLSL
ncbi:hypothetical protein [Thermogemmatispora sp.]|uniref:hypothetical protein n=1 Tax=Thermogemmatispora sp. TaxID=1968838 RepID=UPI0035E40FBE